MGWETRANHVSGRERNFFLGQDAAFTQTESATHTPCKTMYTNIEINTTQIFWKHVNGFTTVQFTKANTHSTDPPASCLSVLNYLLCIPTGIKCV